MHFRSSPLYSTTFVPQLQLCSGFHKALHFIPHFVQIFGLQRLLVHPLIFNRPESGTRAAVSGSALVNRLGGGMPYGLPPYLSLCRPVRLQRSWDSRQVVEHSSRQPASGSLPEGRGAHKR